MQNIDTRDRLLTLIDILSRTSSSVKEIQEQFINDYGVAPDRKTLYQDLVAIEKHYPLYVIKQKDYYGVPRYSL